MLYFHFDINDKTHVVTKHMAELRKVWVSGILLAKLSQKL